MHLIWLGIFSVNLMQKMWQQMITYFSPSHLHALDLVEPLLCESNMYAEIVEAYRYLLCSHLHVLDAVSASSLWTQPRWKNAEAYTNLDNVRITYICLIQLSLFSVNPMWKIKLQKHILVIWTPSRLHIHPHVVDPVEVSSFWTQCGKLQKHILIWTLSRSHTSYMCLIWLSLFFVITLGAMVMDEIWRIEWISSFCF